MRADRSLFSKVRGLGRLGQNRILGWRCAESKPGCKPPSWSGQKGVRSQSPPGGLPRSEPWPWSSISETVPLLPGVGCRGPSPFCLHPPPLQAAPASLVSTCLQHLGLFFHLSHSQPAAP